MIEICVLDAVAFAIAGGAMGFLLAVTLGIRREEAAYSMTEPTPDPVARWAGSAAGVYAGFPGVAAQVRGDQRLVGQELVNR